MTIKNASNEACTNCVPSQSEVTDAASADESARVTYNDGEGIKDRVVLSGPLSQVLEEQLHVIFKKQEFQTQEEAPALETLANDVAISAAFKAAAEQPDNQVILSNFDVVSIKDHLDRMAKERPTNSDLANYTTIPVLATDPDSLLDGPALTDVQLKSEDELVLVVKPVLNNSQGRTESDFLLRTPSEMIAKTLRTEPETKELRMANDEPSLQEKVEAIERIYGTHFKRIHIGVEAFVTSLIERRKAR